MLSEYLTVPLKKGFDVDLVKPIMNFIADANYSGSPTEYSVAVLELQKLRSDFIGKASDKDEKAQKILYRYCDQFSAIENKFPLAENQVRIKFKWQDAFKKESKKSSKKNNNVLTIASGSYEKACVLFNVAALQTIIADQQKLILDDGLKTAAKLFQQASGIFSYLVSLIPTFMSEYESTNDLQVETLSALSALALAQAQDVFVKKAVKDDMKPNIVSRLAQQCAFLYEDALKQMQVESVRALWAKDWIGTVTSRQLAYEALAQYYQGVACVDDKIYGEAVARLKYAKDLMAKSSSKSESKIFPFSSQKSSIESQFSSVEKDNNFIYHAKVPETSGLANIERAPLAKPVTYGESPLSSDFSDLFERFQPMAVHVALASFEERKMEVIHKEITRIRETTQILNSVLVSLNLPAGIEDVSGEKVPRSIILKSATIRQMGGFEHLNRLVNDLPTMLQKSKSILDESERLVMEEENVDRQLRNKYRADWSRTHSEQLNRPIREEISKYRTIINNAIQADGLVKQRYFKDRNSIALLSQTDGDIERNLPPVNLSLTSFEGKQFVSNLRELMEQVKNLRAERENLEKQMKEAKSDIASKFLAAYKKEGVILEESLSSTELERIYGTFREQIARSFLTQDRLIQQIQNANAEFIRFRSQGQSQFNETSTREFKLKELATAFDSFMELNAIAEEGIKFYGDLTVLLEKFKKKVKEFCDERNKEKEELIKEMPDIPSPAPMPTLVTPYQYTQPSFLTSQMVYSSIPSAATVYTVGSGYPPPRPVSASFFCGSTPMTYNPYFQYQQYQRH